MLIIVTWCGWQPVAGRLGFLLDKRCRYFIDIHFKITALHRGEEIGIPGVLLLPCIRLVSPAVMLLMDGAVKKGGQLTVSYPSFGGDEGT